MAYTPPPPSVLLLVVGETQKETYGVFRQEQAQVHANGEWRATLNLGRRDECYDCR